MLAHGEQNKKNLGCLEKEEKSFSLFNFALKRIERKECSFLGAEGKNVFVQPMSIFREQNEIHISMILFSLLEGGYPGPRL